MPEIVITVVAVYMTSAMVNLMGLAELKNTKIVEEDESVTN